MEVEGIKEEKKRIKEGKKGEKEKNRILFC